MSMRSHPVSMRSHSAPSGHASTKDFPTEDLPSYFIGLDLGQQHDYTALTVVEEQPKKSGSAKDSPSEYHLRHLERFDLGTPYQAVARRTRYVQAQLGETQPGEGQSYVVADATGVGGPVIEMLRAEGVRQLRSVTITGGDAPSRDGSEHRVPKRDLVSTLQVLLQARRLRFAKGLPGGPVLRAELQNFRAKISLSGAGHDRYEAWREGDHDDLVLSLAMACWFAEHAHVQIEWLV